jgi:Taurine catabolism dioxygenase TauD, TfdA family
MTISFDDVDGPLGSYLELRSLVDLTRDPAAMAGLREALDHRVVVHMLLAEPARTIEIESVVAMLGEPETRGLGPMMVSGSDMLVNFSAKARHDDGRPRTPAFIESLHCDVMANGPAAYGVHYSPLAPPTAPMRFVDMRAAYEALPQGLRSKLAPLRARHDARPRTDGTPTPWTMQPLIAKHPRTGQAVLLLPNRRDCRLEGMDAAESSALTTALWKQLESLPSQHQVPLRDRTLVIWDNIACVHDNPAFPRDRDRETWFLNVLNDRPIEPAPRGDARR